MDVHRCRFVNYQPSAINALAFTHSSGVAGRNQPLRLAIGRANGDIEIWDPRKGLWIHELTLRGGKDRSVEGLAWIQDPDERAEDGFIKNGKLRLFSIGYSSTVTEWGLISGLPLRQSSGSHSEVWCLAAQPKERLGGKKTEQHGKPQDLVVGCADGSLILLSTADDELSFQKYVARASKKNARALSLTFQDRNTLVAGFADSAIRVYNIANGNLLRTMSLGAGPQGGPKEKLVWTLDCLKDGTIVSGDSTGEVCFWDCKTYSQQQRVKGHEADILCLTGGEDGKTVISGGIDRRTVVYNLTSKAGQKTRWSKTAHSRYHKHDIKAMARFENPKMSLVVSGGLDTMPILTPIREYGKEYHRTLPYAPQNPQLASSGRFVVSWENNEMTVWRILRKKRTSSVFGDDGEEPNYKRMAQLALKGDENIASASITSSGALLAVSTSAETKVFQLRPRRTGTLKVTKLDTPAALSKSKSRIVQFSPDGNWLLCVSLESKLSIVRLQHGPSTADPVAILATLTSLQRLRRDRTKQNSLNGEWGRYDRTITRAAFSSDSRMLAVSDLDGSVDTFVLEGNEDSTAPAVDSAPHRRSSSSPAKSSDDSLSEYDSNSDSDDETSMKNRTTIIYGQHWTNNPSAVLIPRLPSNPIVMSFQPMANPASISTNHHIAPNGVHLPNGNPAVHPTRNNPHAHANTIPPEASGADRLFILTATHEIYEFEVLKGKQTDWSRRNTARMLPQEFKLQRDRAMGCVWDVSRSVSDEKTKSSNPKVSDEQRTRIWLYGPSWVCMFDLNQDLPEPDTRGSPSSGDNINADVSTTAKGAKALTNGTATQKGTTTPSSALTHKQQPPNDQLLSKKRKLDAPTTSQDLARKRNTTGAGSKIPDHELGGGVGARTINKVEADGTVSSFSIDVPAAKVPSEGDDSDSDDLDDDDDEGEQDDGQSALTRLRRGAREPANGDSSADDMGKRNPPFYLTNRYRPILGILPMARSSSLKGAKAIGAAGLDATNDPDVEDDGEDDDEDDGERPIEVALIERPFFDLDLPPRFVSAQDRDD